ncbi:Uncharacterized protein DBV15_10499 [Temnothorax longispinosus]|uniref:Uncharacterized protein n=1 Tax=Temnothorax longispinosus TaxID=300112 RepID=A0A4S2KLC8_9HYME|nr:Uncharacterized protein DBV15_10499 [Temnothorax longispinosus]
MPDFFDRQLQPDDDRIINSQDDDAVTVVRGTPPRCRVGVNLPRMQQASVGGCDEDSGTTSPTARSPIGFAIKSEPGVDRNDGVRVKVEMPEPTEAGVEVKGEPREDYLRQQPSNDGYHYGDKKPGYVLDAPGQPPPVSAPPPPPPHQGYRPVGLPNSFGFPPFYGHHHPAMMPASFPTGRPSSDGPIGKIGDRHEQTTHVDRHAAAAAAYGRLPLIHNDGFLHESHHHRFDAGDFHQHGVPYPGFRPTMRSYGNHQNNSAYSRSGHYHPARQRKWSSSAFRGLHPPMPVTLHSIQLECIWMYLQRNDSRPPETRALAFCIIGAIGVRSKNGATG